MGFFSNLLQQHVDSAVDAVKAAAILANPTAGSKAEIQTILDALGTDNGRLSELQITLEAATRAVAADEAEIHRVMDAAAFLSKAGKDDKAGPLLDSIDKTLNPKLASDKKSLASLNMSVAQFGKHKEMLEGKLRDAQTNTANSVRELESAKLDAQLAKEQESQAARDAGLLTSVSDINIATDALAKAAAKVRAQADTSRRNAASMQSIASPSTSTDPDVAAAFAAASGAATPATSVADRLAAMRASMSGEKAA